MYTYWLPSDDGKEEEHETESNSLVIIGANGSGKSKLGAWIEEKNLEQVHRIGAQRNLNFNENISLKNYSQAEELVFYGSSDNSSWAKKKGPRWNGGKDATTKLIDDFEIVLAALIALKNNENDIFVERCKEASKNNTTLPMAPKTVVDKLIEIWQDVLPQRDLILEDSKFFASLKVDEKEKRYSANQMSDGERAVLYLAAQVLCVPQEKTLIIDEPEVHLHRSIMNKLWCSLEKSRSDCFFIYITHDVQFAAMHADADKIWIKNYDGENWSLEKLESTELPEDLVLEILGARRNVLFVEGNPNSLDTQLYSEIYNNYYVVACGSCTQVITRTKAFRNNKSLHDCNVYGVIDRDYRSDYEIEKYKADGIYCIGVAEVENLFITEELVKTMASHMGLNPDEVFENVKKYVIDERFNRQLQKQIRDSVVAKVKYKLNCVDISKNNGTGIADLLKEKVHEINIDDINRETEIVFKEALTERDYKKVIRVFNEKSIAKTVGQYMNIKNDEYCRTILSLLKSDYRDDIVDALIPYLPIELEVE